MSVTETGISAELVGELLREQHPDLAGSPLRLGARGWDNQVWRLGEDLAVRLPWATESADELLRKEYAWLPSLAPRLPPPVPVPQRLEEPSARFPCPWIVTTWVPGTPADQAPATRWGLLRVHTGQDGRRSGRFGPLRQQVARELIGEGDAGARLAVLANGLPGPGAGRSVAHQPCEISAEGSAGWPVDQICDPADDP